MSKKKKRKQQYSVSPEEIQLIEKDLVFRCYKSHQDVPHANSFLWSGNHKMQSK